MCIYTKIENNISIYNYLVISIIYLYLLWVCLSYLYVILLILLFLLSQIAMLPQGQHQIWSLPDNDLECLLLLLSHSYSITTSSFRSVLGYVHVSEGATETKNPKCTGAWGRWLWTFDIDLTLPVRALHTRDLWAMSPVSCTIFMWCRSSNPGLLCMLGKYSTNWATPQNCHSHLENEMFYRYWKFWNFLLYRGYLYLWQWLLFFFFPFLLLLCMSNSVNFFPLENLSICPFVIYILNNLFYWIANLLKSLDYFLKSIHPKKGVLGELLKSADIYHLAERIFSTYLQILENVVHILWVGTWLSSQQPDWWHSQD